MIFGSLLFNDGYETLGVIYIVSIEKDAGKTAVCAGLARIVQNSGKTAGYLKPHILPGDEADRDIAFMKELLGKTEAGPEHAGGREVVFVEAMLGHKPDDLASRTTCGAAREMQASVIAVEAWTGNESPFIDVYKGFGDALTGLILNKVPKSRFAAAAETVKAQCEAAGIALLGVIPEDRTLLSVTVQELAEKFSGDIINNREKAGEFVENFMVGALIVDSGLTYFGRKTQKAAILRQDRPDMQFAALETPTACLLLGGSREKPLYNVLQKAEQRQIPVIVTDMPVRDIADGIDDMLLATPFRHEQKVDRLAKLLRENIDTKLVVQERR